MRDKLIEILESAESAVVWNSDDRNFIERIADHLIANGVTVEKWISVKERRPRIDGRYIVCNNGYAMPAHYTTYAPGMRSWFGEFSELHNVSHWMPLPEPPKGTEE